jgi:hypothetical protein
MAAAVALAMNACGTGDDTASCSDRDGFDEQAWLRAGRSDDTVRDRLGPFKRIVRCDLLTGKSKRQVLAMLGPPSEGERPTREWTYVIGGNFFEATLATIHFDADGRVIQAFKAQG